jgi:hypothetical protein
MITAAKAATKAAQNPPLEVSKTSQLRDLATSSSRIFGWDKKTGPQTQFNQVVITQEQLERMRQLCDSMTPEEKEESKRRAITPLGDRSERPLRARRAREALLSSQVLRSRG